MRIKNWSKSKNRRMSKSDRCPRFGWSLKAPRESAVEVVLKCFAQKTGFYGICAPASQHGTPGVSILQMNRSWSVVSGNRLHATDHGQRTTDKSQKGRSATCPKSAHVCALRVPRHR